MNKTIYRNDYRPLIWQARSIHMLFDLDPHKTVVTTVSQFERLNEGRELRLNGEGLVTKSIKLSGRTLNKTEYRFEENELVIPILRDNFELETITEIDPSANLALTGLYMSDGYFCTQCEAQGFRRITWSLDRPDNQSIYDVEIRADAKKFPVLLSNGNPSKKGILADGRAFAKWYDPFPKPSYLFALVAGDLAHIEDSFTTKSGKNIVLRIFTLQKYLDQSHYAMGALKRAMKWDEDKYGCEYDLEHFNIVATDDFNMGAMENKGLNIFNTRLVLADDQTAIDGAFINVEAVIGHEYFHNWSGNRVTCRDWFQLSLKEGFTVFRDQQFTADMHSAGVKRINDVALLRSAQFKEDAGPLAHSVRPDSYESINNFYTVTIYEKGAEIVRMLHNILGEEQFRKGSDYYFSNYDGQAATCDDFVASMESVSGLDLTHFKKWYSQAGTPVIHIERVIDGDGIQLTIKQHTPPTQGQPEKEALFIPVDCAFFSECGSFAKIKSVEGCDYRLADDCQSVVLYVDSDEQVISLKADCNIKTASFLRGFSAPVKLVYETTTEDDAFIARYETDPFSSWEAGRRIFNKYLLNTLNKKEADIEGVVAYVEEVLKSDRLDNVLKAEMVFIPTTGDLLEYIDVPCDPKEIANVRWQLQYELAQRLKGHWSQCATITDEPYALTNEQIGKRSLAAIAYSMLKFDELEIPRIVDAYKDSHNLTDRISTLTAVLGTRSKNRLMCLIDFYNKAKDYPLLVNEWFAVQIYTAREDALKTVRNLMDHPDYNEQNPNRLRSVIGGMIRNPYAFHEDKGKGYALLADTILSVDSYNPEMAASLARAYAIFPRLNNNLAMHMKIHIERILERKDLSSNSSEILTKIMAHV